MPAFSLHSFTTEYAAAADGHASFHAFTKMPFRRRFAERHCFFAAISAMISCQLIAIEGFSLRRDAADYFFHAASRASSRFTRCAAMIEAAARCR